MKHFPKDCKHDCPHYSSYDMSIDDWVSRCSLLKAQCDDCDQDYCFLMCPLPDQV